jgi:hypothetical protein
MQHIKKSNNPKGAGAKPKYNEKTTTFSCRVPVSKKAELYALADDYYVLSGLANLYETFMNDIHRKATAEWDTKLKAYIQDNLKQFGYSFEIDAEFFEFCKNRVHRIVFDKNPNYYEFYLDFVDADNKGTFIGSCSD